MTLLARIAALEREIQPKDASTEARGPTIEQIRKGHLWTLMRQTMNPDHAAIVERYMTEGGGYPMMAGPTALGYVCNQTLLALAWKRNLDYTPWADMHCPPAVAELFLGGDNWLPLHNCADCGRKYPVQRIDACLLCDGSVGYAAYYTTHRRAAPSLTWNGLTALLDEGIDLSAFDFTAVMQRPEESVT